MKTDWQVKYTISDRGQVRPRKKTHDNGERRPNVFQVLFITTIFVPVSFQRKLLDGCHSIVRIHKLIIQLNTHLVL